MLLHQVILRLQPVSETGFFDEVLGIYYLQNNAHTRFKEIASCLGSSDEELANESPYHRRGYASLPTHELFKYVNSIPSGGYHYDLYVKSSPTSDRERIVETVTVYA